MTPAERAAAFAAQAHDAILFEDWTQSMIPPPWIGVEGVEPGEPHVPLVMGESGAPDPRVRHLSADQCRDLAAALNARADVIDPNGATP